LAIISGKDTTEMFVKNISLLSMVIDTFIISSILDYCYVFKSRYFVVNVAEKATSVIFVY